MTKDDELTLEESQDMIDRFKCYVCKTEEVSSLFFLDERFLETNRRGLSFVHDDNKSNNNVNTIVGSR